MATGPANAETPMEARIARLESDVTHLVSDATDSKADVRAWRDKMDALAGPLSGSARTEKWLARTRRLQTAAPVSWRLPIVIAALCVGASAPLSAQTRGEPVREASAAVDEIVVRGRINERKRMRLELERAEEIVFERFNEINSDDRFDIHCDRQTRLNSNISERVCLSNIRRTLDSAIGQAVLRGARSEYGLTSDYYRGERPLMQERLEQELRRLTEQDPALRDAMVRWENARRSLLADAPERPTWTASVEVPQEDLPVQAERVFAVRVGTEMWSHLLAARTFTIADIDGRIRGLEVVCSQNGVRLDFAAGMEWTVPASWSDCRVLVRAKRGTTFALYELAALTDPSPVSR